MINIDFLTLKAFLIENLDFLLNARLQKIQQPTRRDFIFSLRNNSESRKLYININPQIYHICFMSIDNEEKRNISIPKHPPMFCMLLRKYLEGCKIVDVNVVENERILEFHFEVCDEFSQRRLLCLCVEFMGKHSNIILYDEETSIIVGCAHNVGSEKSRYRELQGGLKYIYPPTDNNIHFSNELQIQFANLQQEKINNYLDSEVFFPAIKGDRYTLFKELLDDSIAQDNVSSMLDNYYSEFQKKQLLNSEKSILMSNVQAKLRKVNNSISKVSSLLQKRDNTDRYKLYGELLTANLYQNCNYQKHIEVLNYFTGENIIIELDETKTLNENAQRYYKLYTKSKLTKEKSLEYLKVLNIEKDYLDNIIYSLNISDNFSELEEIKEELGLVNISKKSDKKFIVNKLDINGFDVYLGKNNKQNDYIVSKLAKDEDIWFHTRLCAGSHVLLKVNGIEPDEATIFECCKLARNNSSASQSSKVGVIYTKAKYLKKPPASPLGYVTYKNEKEILV